LYSFKIGEQIRFCVRVEEPPNEIGTTSEDDFVLRYSTIENPQDYTDVRGTFIKEGEYYFTPLFLVFKSGKYFASIENEKDELYLKVQFNIEDEMISIQDCEIVV